jgi:hypothetical protein
MFYSVSSLVSSLFCDRVFRNDVTKLKNTIPSLDTFNFLVVAGDERKHLPTNAPLNRFQRLITHKLATSTTAGEA